jgi:hypothetical protein
MRAMRGSLALLVLSGCVQAEIGGPGDQQSREHDAAVFAVVDGGADLTDSGGTTTDGGRDGVVDAAVDCSPGLVQLLGDPGFDSADGSWTAQGGTIVFASGEIPIAPAAGARAARFLGQNNADQHLRQSVAVPAGTTSLVLSGQRCFVTDEPGGAADTLAIRLLDPAGGPLETLASLSNADAGATCSWQPFSLTSPAPHAGQTIQLDFHAASDSLRWTSFYLDSLRLDADVTCD